MASLPVFSKKKKKFIEKKDFVKKAKQIPRWFKTNYREHENFQRLAMSKEHYSSYPVESTNHLWVSSSSEVHKQFHSEKPMVQLQLIIHVQLQLIYLFFKS
jgi:hypothetical protein